MKGIVFTEFLDFVAETWGVETADDVIEDCDLPSGGAYTSVGTYSHHEMAALVAALAKRTDLSVDVLLRRFGHHLGLRFAELYPDFYREQPSLFAFLDSVDAHIHEAVRKLYADAELPEFRTRSRSDDSMIMEYRSSRHLQCLAEGMIMGAADYFRQPVQVAARAVTHGPDPHVELTIGLRS